MQMYINNTLLEGENPTSNLHIFPISIKRNSNPGARVLSEVNLTSIVRGLTDKDAFVISSSFESDKDFEFIIHGYYCRIESSVIPSCFRIFPNGPIYAVILIKGSSKDYPILDASETVTGTGSSAVSTFTGVQFVSSPEEVKNDEGYQPYLLHILTKEGEDIFTIPFTSRTRFELTSIDLNELEAIDGGEE